MRLVTKLLVVAVGLGVVAEIAAPGVVESRIEDRVRDRTRDTVGVAADVDSFPLVTRLLVTGEVRRLSVRLDEVTRRRLKFATISYELEGVRLDRSAAVRGQVRLRDVERGRIVAELLAGDLASGFGVPVDLAPGDVRAEVTDRVLHLTEGVAAALSEQLPADVLPCDPSVATDDGKLVLECAFSEIPPILLRAAEQATRG